jgi:hypothetical protein
MYFIIGVGPYDTLFSNHFNFNDTGLTHCKSLDIHKNEEKNRKINKLNFMYFLSKHNSCIINNNFWRFWIVFTFLYYYIFKKILIIMLLHLYSQKTFITFLMGTSKEFNRLMICAFFMYHWSNHDVAGWVSKGYVWFVKQYWTTQYNTKQDNTWQDKVVPKKDREIIFLIFEIKMIFFLYFCCTMDKRLWFGSVMSKNSYFYSVSYCLFCLVS